MDSVLSRRVTLYTLLRAIDMTLIETFDDGLEQNVSWSNIMNQLVQILYIIYLNQVSWQKSVLAKWLEQTSQ